MNSNIFSMLEEGFTPAFEFILHALISSFIILYYGLAASKHLAERQNKAKYTVTWLSLRKIFAVVFILAEPFFLYQNIIADKILFPELAIALQVAGIIVVLISFSIFKSDKTTNTYKSTYKNTYTKKNLKTYKKGPK